MRFVAAFVTAVYFFGCILGVVAIYHGDACLGMFCAMTCGGSLCAGAVGTGRDGEVNTRA